jgi:hypothetical protein
MAAPMLVPGAIAATCAAIVMKTPAEPAPAPLGATYTITGIGAARRSFTTVRADVSRPPGVSSSISSAAAPSVFARSIASATYAATAGPIAPSTTMRCTTAARAHAGRRQRDGRARRRRPRASLPRDRQPEDAHDLLDVLPNEAACRRVPQQVRRVERRHQHDALVVEPAAAELRDRRLRAQQGLRRELPSATITSGPIARADASGMARTPPPSSGSGLRLPGGRHFTTLQM